MESEGVEDQIHHISNITKWMTRSMEQITRGTRDHVALNEEDWYDMQHAWLIGDPADHHS